MKASNELVIRIDPESLRIRLESNENGVISCKEISDETFYDCIKDSVRAETVTSGLLPRNCFHVSMNMDKSRDYCLWHPERYADISYYGTAYPNFPLPRLVFGFRLSAEGKVSGCRIGVIQDETPTAKTVMYEYPFSNVGGFALCTGNNPLPTYKSPHALATLPYFLLSLPNNNDSFRRNNNRLGMEHRELLHHLKDKEPAYYYSDVLVASGKTLADFMAGR